MSCSARYLSTSCWHLRKVRPSTEVRPVVRVFIVSHLGRLAPFAAQQSDNDTVELKETIKELMKELQGSEGKGRVFSHLERREDPDRFADHIHRISKSASFFQPNREVPEQDRTSALDENFRKTLSLREIALRMPAELEFKCQPSVLKRIPFFLPECEYRAQVLSRVRWYVDNFINPHAAPDHQCTLLTGPVGSGKTSLALAMGLLPIIVRPGKAACVFYEAKSGQEVLPAEMLLAGLYRGGVFTREDVKNMGSSAGEILNAVAESGYAVMFVVDEAQRLFQPDVRGWANELKDQIEDLAVTGTTLSTIFSGSSSLSDLFFNPDAVSTKRFPSKAIEPFNSTKIHSLVSPRVGSADDLDLLLADLRRDAILERSLGAATNAKWNSIAKLIREVDRLDPQRLREEHLKDLLGASFVDHAQWPTLRMNAWIYSRGLPRRLKTASVSKREAAIIIPWHARRVLKGMYDLLTRNPETRGSIEAAVARGDFSLLGYCGKNEASGDLDLDDKMNLFAVQLSDLRKVIPASEMSPRVLESLVDEGYITRIQKPLSDVEWIRFSSALDYVLLSDGIELPSNLSLVAVLYGKGTDLEMISTDAMQHAFRTRFESRGVQRVASCLGISSKLESATVLTDVGKKQVDFRGVDEFRAFLAANFPALLAEVPAGKKTADVLADSLEPNFDAFVYECSMIHPEAVPSFSAASLSDLPRHSLIEAFSLFTHHSSADSVYEAFGVNVRSGPVVFQPWPDSIGTDRVIVSPDGSLTLVQMKHGFSGVKDEQVARRLFVGVQLLRSWLRGKGVAVWNSVPIRRVLWTTQDIPSDSKCFKTGVCVLQKKDFAPMWRTEMLRLLVLNKKEHEWGVEDEVIARGLQSRD